MKQKKRAEELILSPLNSQFFNLLAWVLAMTAATTAAV
jgi:hypothetical protein